MNEKKKRFDLFVIIFVLSGSVMIAHAARMMYQGIFRPDSYYPAPTPSTIDFYFDWLTLLVLGIIVFSYSLYIFFRNQKIKIEKEVDIIILQGE